MAARLRSRLQMDQRRAQLLELGLKLFGTRAYDGVSIDDIAAAAEVSKGLLYHYFGSKRDFYLETVRHAAHRLLDALEPDYELEPVERALAGLHAYLSFVEQRAEAYAALISSGLGADPEVADVVEQTRLAIIGRMMLDLGLKTPRPVFRVALRSYIGAVEAAAIEWLDRRDVERSTLLHLMALQLRGALEAAVALDPEAGVELAALHDSLPRRETG